MTRPNISLPPIVGTMAAVEGADTARPKRERKPRSTPSDLLTKGFPAFQMARDLAGHVFPVSESVLLQVARKHGIGRKIGRAIIFSPADCQQLYEVLPCPSDSSAVPNRPTGSSVGPSAESALKKYWR